MSPLVTERRSELARRRAYTPEQRRAIHEAFESMASDPEYTAEARKILQEFEHADAETLRHADD